MSFKYLMVIVRKQLFHKDLLVLTFVSGLDWKVKYLRERKRSTRLLTALRQSRLDSSAYRSLVRELKLKVSYYKYK